MITSSILVALHRHLVKSDLFNFTAPDSRPQIIQNNAVLDVNSDNRITIFGAYEQLAPMKLESNEIEVKF